MPNALTSSFVIVAVVVVVWMTTLFQSCKAFVPTMHSSSSIRHSKYVVPSTTQKCLPMSFPFTRSYSTAINGQSSSKHHHHHHHHSFLYSGSIRPGKQSPQRTILPTRPNSNTILLPDYALDGIPKKMGQDSQKINIKTPEEIERMREVGKLTRQILDLAGRAVQVGVTTDEIDCLVHDAIVAAGAYPSPLNFYGYPKSCCTSVNEVYVFSKHFLVY